ncbi:hypothetical protein K1X12_15455 [Hyphomonas sp. WL0036]|uniref:hypothetical protein n=1 Tax=Hyphomonas sediminis TaxID=2866160 RepID=UPI001C7FFF2A|nr:hypothetical protein [Hyphomonas sediminis]MBY9068297.1 hypothetical protein [Hyphomonas sediminis]
MDTPDQPADDYTELDYLLGRAFYLVMDLIELVTGALTRLGAAPMGAALRRHLIAHAVVPAEAAMRRAILLIAGTLPVPAAPAPASGPKPKAAPTGEMRETSGPRAPVFSMFEPQPSAAKNPGTDYLLEHLLPRVTALVDSVLYARPDAPKASAQAADPMARFLRRFEALQAALDCPLREARRWVRRQARLTAAAAPPRSPLSPRRIPGDRPSLNHHARSLLNELNEAANEVLAGGALPNTS